MIKHSVLVHGVNYFGKYLLPGAWVWGKLLGNIKHLVLEPEPNYLSGYAPFSIEAQHVSFGVGTTIHCISLGQMILVAINHLQLLLFYFDWYPPPGVPGPGKHFGRNQPPWAWAELDHRLRKAGLGKPGGGAGKKQWEMGASCTV